ncbi:hypothetical protein CBF45_07300 [Bordetella sp. J329]|nr:hypothetical protein CBF45_07300 [Bordetella sp. J329]
MDDHTPGAAKMVPLDQTAEIDIKKVRRYLDTCGCLAHSGVRALVEKEVAAQCRGAGPAARVNDDGFIVETGLPLAPGTKLYAHPPSAQAEPVSGADGLPIELRGVLEAVAEGDGFWRSCSGCHELNEGHDTGPQSKVFKCALGNGCSECGGIGAVWDTTDYGAMGDALAASMAQPQPSGNAQHVDDINVADIGQAVERKGEPSGNAGELPANIIDALKFYADRSHFIVADGDAWDTVSGEPQNLWCDEAGTATVEDGSIARAALAAQASGQEFEAVDLRELANIGKAVNRAALELPSGWGICIQLERGAGTVYLSDPGGCATMIDDGELFSEQINTAIDAAHAAAKEQ